MPENVAPADHRKVKGNFLQIVNRWKARYGYTVEFHAVLDLTNERNAHWDVVAYSDAPKKALRAAISEAWARAGGLRQTLVELDPDELEGSVRYAAKDTEKTRIQVRRGGRYIPAERAVLGLEHHWSTGGFWRGRTITTIWAELIREWFGEGVADEVVSNKENTLLASTSTSVIDPETAYRETVKMAEFRYGIEYRLEALDDPQNIVNRIRRHLPHDAAKAPSVRTIASQWGLSTHYVRSLLIGIKGAVRIDGNGHNEWGEHDRFWIDPSSITIINKQEFKCMKIATAA